MRVVGGVYWIIIDVLWFWLFSVVVVRVVSYLVVIVVEVGIGLSFGLCVVCLGFL